jgi:crotonobetainyl-CoA:carnitine CoA-transferase CaiB-like acyl-CoA transferase
MAQAEPGVVSLATSAERRAANATRPADRPLSGVRVLSVEQFGAGPYGTMFLADMGAEVIKIENPKSGGDPSRYTGPYMLGEQDGQYFQSWNLGKRSITLDLKSAKGRDAFFTLVREADAVVNNLRGDLPSSLGLDYASLAPINASVVCLHLSAYGRDNSRAAWPGYDYLMQAESGIMGLTGEPGSPPARIGAPSMVDQVTGMTSTVGLLAALLRARDTGVGCDVDACLYDTAIHQLGYAATWYLNQGHVSERQARSAHFSVAPVQTFPTSDGWVMVMCMTQRFWEALLTAIGGTSLQQDPRFATPAARMRHRDELTAALDAIFRAHSTAHWQSKLEGVVPIAPVLSLQEALDGSFMQETGMLGQVDHPLRPGGLRVLSNPLRFDGRRPTRTACSPLGADNADILGEEGAS